MKSLLIIVITLAVFGAIAEARRRGSGGRGGGRGRSVGFFGLSAASDDAGCQAALTSATIINEDYRTNQAFLTVR